MKSKDKTTIRMNIKKNGTLEEFLKIIESIEEEELAHEKALGTETNDKDKFDSIISS